MKKTIIYLMVFMLVYINMLSVSGENIVTDPKTITIDLTGGDIVTKNITIRFPCNNPSYFNISTNITPDGEGLNITYAYFFPDDIYTNTDYLVEMTVNTSMLIVPGVYTITTIFYCECKSGDGDWDHSSHSWTPSLPDDDEPSSPTPPDDAPDTIELKEPDDEPDAPDDPDDDITFVFPLILFAILFIIFLLYYRKKKGVEKK